LRDVVPHGPGGHVCAAGEIGQRNLFGIVHRQIMTV
jgi:hypothetical protein